MAVPDVAVYLQIAGNWVDVTDAVRKTDGIRHARGRRSEGARVDASSTTLTLDDPAGTYNSRNPRSPYYGQLGRNTPIRYTVGGAAVALVIPPGEIARCHTADAPALDITGDIDIRVDMTPSSWTGARGDFGWEVLGKAGSSQGSYWMFIQSEGLISFVWSSTGSDTLGAFSSVPVPFAPGQRGAIRATLDVNNGAGGHTAVFYTAPTMAGPWVQLGDPDVQPGVTSIFAGTAALQIGNMTSFDYPDIARRYHSVEIRNGIGGTVVANPDFTAQPSLTSAFTDGAGRNWTTTGEATITARRVRAVGEVSEWAPRWHVSGSDVRAPITAAGIMRRLSQGRRPLKSVLTRAIPTFAPVAYWPLEDGKESTQAYSPLPGVQPLRVQGLNMAADSSFAASDALPTIAAGATLTGTVPAYTGSTWEIDFYYKLDSAPASLGTVLEWKTSGIPWRIWRLRFGPTTADLIVEDGAGATTLVTSVPLTYAFGTGWHQFVIIGQQFGSDLDVTVTGGGATLLGATTGQVTGFSTTFGASLAGAGFGQLAVYNSAPYTSSYATAWQGETAAARVLRLCTEESIPVDVWGNPLTQEAMGYQRPAQLLDLLAECEAADGGILFEDRNRLALIYQSRESLYTRAPLLTIPYGHLAELGPPRDDDTRIRNDRTVSRTNGSFGRWSQDTGPMSTLDAPAGVGLYEDEVTLNVAADDQCQPIAQWLVHLGTVDEARYPQIKILLHKYPQYVDAVTSLDVGSVIRVTGLPSHLPPGPLDLLVEGYEEALGPLSWEITLTCSPASPWRVAIADDAVYGRADTAGSTLAAAVSTTTATTLSVATTTGPLWTTSGFPFDIRVAGEVMTVTAVSGSTSPQTFTVIRSVNGIAKTHASGTAVSLAQAAVAAL